MSHTRRIEGKCVECGRCTAAVLLQQLRMRLNFNCLIFSNCKLWFPPGEGVSLVKGYRQQEERGETNVLEFKEICLTGRFSLIAEGRHVKEIRMRRNTRFQTPFVNNLRYCC